MKYFVWIFIARVMIPMNVVTYNNVESFIKYVESRTYELRLSDGRTIWVPMEFTIIEEKR